MLSVTQKCYLCHWRPLILACLTMSSQLPARFLLYILDHCSMYCEGVLARKKGVWKAKVTLSSIDIRTTLIIKCLALMTCLMKTIIRTLLFSYFCHSDIDATVSHWTIVHDLYLVGNTQLQFSLNWENMIVQIAFFMVQISESLG